MVKSQFPDYDEKPVGKPEEVLLLEVLKEGQNVGLKVSYG